MDTPPLPDEIADLQTHFIRPSAIDAAVRVMILSAGEDPDEHDFSDADIKWMRDEAAYILAAASPHLAESEAIARIRKVIQGRTSVNALDIYAALGA